MMRGTVAKRLRKKIYLDKDFRKRTYTDIIHSQYVWLGKTFEKVTKVSDKERKWYKNAKKLYTQFTKHATIKKEKKDESSTSTNS